MQHLLHFLAVWMLQNVFLLSTASIHNFVLDDRCLICRIMKGFCYEHLSAFQKCTQIFFSLEQFPVGVQGNFGWLGQFLVGFYCLHARKILALVYVLPEVRSPFPAGFFVSRSKFGLGSRTVEAAKVRQNFSQPGKSWKYVPKNILKITYISEPPIPPLTIPKHYHGFANLWPFLAIFLPFF